MKGMWKKTLTGMLIVLLSLNISAVLPQKASATTDTTITTEDYDAGILEFSEPHGLWEVTYDKASRTSTVEANGKTWTFNHNNWEGQGMVSQWDSVSGAGCSYASPCKTASGKYVYPTDKYVSLSMNFPGSISLNGSPIPTLYFGKGQFYAEITNLSNNETGRYQIVDRGPGLRIGRPVDMTQAVMDELGLKTDDIVKFKILGGPPAPPPPQTPTQKSQQLAPALNDPSPIGTNLCYESFVDIDWNEKPIYLSSQNNSLTSLGIDDELDITISHPDGTQANYSQVSNTMDFGPVDMTQYFQPGINHVTTRILDITKPNCGGSAVWLVWDGELSPPDTTLYPQLGVGITKDSSATLYRFEVPDWMHWLFGLIHLHSNATITLIAPDGTIYDPSNPAVHYTYGDHYGMLTLDNPQPGLWQLKVDVIQADPETVFTVGIGGSQGSIPTADIIPPVSFIELAGTHGLNGWFTSDVVVTITAEDNPGGSGVQSIEWSPDMAQTWYTYSGPFTIQEEGISNLLVRATDNAGNKEFQPTITEVKIDKTPPVVQVWTDQTEYTRVQPFVVHYEGYDPLPGSGLWTLTAEFNGQSVQNGQTIDLFWLGLGTYSVVATGEDYAGWITTNRASFKLIATIESLQATVDQLCIQGYITNKGICTSLQQKLNAALEARNSSRIRAAIGVLNAFQAEIQAQTGPQPGKHISPNAAHLLLMDSSYVIQTLGGK